MEEEVLRSAARLRQWFASRGSSSSHAPPRDSWHKEATTRGHFDVGAMASMDFSLGPYKVEWRNHVARGDGANVSHFTVGLLTLGATIDIGP